MGKQPRTREEIQERDETEGPAIDLNPRVEETGEPAKHANDAKGEAKAAAEEKTPRQTDPPPICPACGVKCVAKSSTQYKTYYYCPGTKDAEGNVTVCPAAFSYPKPRPGVTRRLQGFRNDEPYAARP